ncbi:hypothetical protein ILUMI_17545 [Ignelater luminosus]|uniref:FERM domain-containing protein n=1 Tax=Ignelater luminosus TaxID=2038154 RepID=A0A8K0G7T8_IGNLU|nr:hypothetical protein ILUMI_17545 [Ignelater luminosus]
MLRDNKTRIRTASGYTDAININNGVKQGPQRRHPQGARLRRRPSPNPRHQRRPLESDNHSRTTPIRHSPKIKPRQIVNNRTISSLDNKFDTKTFLGKPVGFCPLKSTAGIKEFIKLVTDILQVNGDGRQVCELAERAEQRMDDRESSTKMLGRCAVLRRFQTIACSWGPNHKPLEETPSAALYPHHHTFELLQSVKDIQPNAQRLKYRVKYYPEDVAQELIEDTTIRYFYLQVRSAILSGKIYCPPETCVLLASYAAQARHGDYNVKLHHNGFLRKEKLLPERVYEQHSMKREDWENNVMKMWQKHYGMLSEDAMLEYLKLTQNLEMYGVFYFDINNKKGTNLLLGVNALGLNIYTKEDRLNPTIAFPWSEIKNINFKGTKFTIKSSDPNSKYFIFYSPEAIINKHILNLSIGNHSLYIRRRKKDSLEVQQMKAKAAEQRRFKLEQRAKLQHETLAREKAEKREQQYQEEIKALKEEMERSQAHLMEAQLTIHKLQEQLRELQIAKQFLEEQQRELKEMMERLEHSKNMEAAERRKLEEEIAVKQEEVLRIQSEVELRDEEARRLQHEIEEANRREEELRLRHEVVRREKEREKELETLPDGASTELPSLVEVNEQLRDELQSLQEQLDQTRVDSKETEMDRIHRQNLREGRDKYKTLNEIRKGNTIRRVDMFENM